MIPLRPVSTPYTYVLKSAIGYTKCRKAAGFGGIYLTWKVKKHCLELLLFYNDITGTENFTKEFRKAKVPGILISEKNSLVLLAIDRLVC